MSAMFYEAQRRHEKKEEENKHENMFVCVFFLLPSSCESVLTDLVFSPESAGTHV